MGDTRGVAGGGRRPGAGARRAADRAVGLVVDFRRGGPRARRVAAARPRVRRSTARPRLARRRPRHPRRPLRHHAAAGKAARRRRLTEFGGTPHRRPDGTWSPGAPTILASYVDGGLGDLVELIHETGHAIHIAVVRTRPAFADWPDSDALTRRSRSSSRSTRANPPGCGAGSRAAAARRATSRSAVGTRRSSCDAAWALLEIRLHAGPDRRASDAWTELTRTTWASRHTPSGRGGRSAGQLVRARLHGELHDRGGARRGPPGGDPRARGDWTDGDPGWFAWVADRIYRFGLERPAGEVIADVLGRAPADAACSARSPAPAPDAPRGRPAERLPPPVRRSPTPPQDQDVRDHRDEQRAHEGATTTASPEASRSNGEPVDPGATAGIAVGAEPREVLGPGRVRSTRCLRGSRPRGHENR